MPFEDNTTCSSLPLYPENPWDYLEIREEIQSGWEPTDVHQTGILDDTPLTMPTAFYNSALDANTHSPTMPVPQDRGDLLEISATIGGEFNSFEVWLEYATM